VNLQLKLADRLLFIYSFLYRGSYNFRGPLIMYYMVCSAGGHVLFIVLLYK